MGLATQKMEARLSKIVKNSKILIINTAFLGDIALTAFLTQRIKNEYNCHISVLTTKSGAEVLSSIKSIDSLFILDKKGTHKSMGDTIEFAKSISVYNFEAIISLHKSYRTSQIVKHIDSKTKIGFDTATNSGVYNRKIKYHDHYHEVERYISTVFDDLNLHKVELDISEDDKLYVENLLIQEKYNDNKKTIILAPGSVWQTKKWGNSRFINLSLLLKEQYNIIFIGSKVDIVDNPIGTINLCGITNFSQTFHLLTLANLIVTNDSAPTHFASIANLPTITIFGATHPMFGFSPLADNSTIIQNENLKCRPCRIHGSEECPLGTHECMTSIKPNEIADKINQLLNSIISQTSQ